MIPPLHQELARIHQAEMRQAAATRRLARQADGNHVAAPIRSRVLRLLGSTIAMTPARLASGIDRRLRILGRVGNP